MQLRAFVEPQLGATYEQQLAVARAAEETGYDAFFRSDHFITFGHGDGLPGPTESWSVLAALARETDRVRLGTLVTSATFRQPGLLAITVAQVDNMSGGRVELGLGTGWNEAEHTAYGVEFPSLNTRFERLEEQLELITGLWTTPVGENYSFAGDHYTLADSPGLPKPTQSPRPPIIVGGGGQKRTPRLAARFADEFNLPPFPHSPEQAKEAFDRVRRACEAIERDPATMRFSAAMPVTCGTDAAELERRAAAVGRSVDMARHAGVAGTVQEVVDQLGAYRDAGCDRVYTQFLDIADVDHVRLVGTEVLAALG